MEVIAGIILILIVIALVSGGFRTFQRNFLVALLTLVVLPPVWVIWAIIEIFRGPVDKNKTEESAVQE